MMPTIMNGRGKTTSSTTAFWSTVAAGLIVVLFLSTSSTRPTSAFAPRSEWPTTAHTTRWSSSSSKSTSSARSVSASFPEQQASSSSDVGGSASDFQQPQLGVNMPDFDEADRIDEETERQVLERQEQLRERSRGIGNYRIQLPLSRSNNALLYGMSVAEVKPGRQISNRVMDLDTMQVQAFELDKQSLSECLEASFRGLIVTSVQSGSPAAQAGVQVGDVINAVSATLGNSVWPTSTLQGIESALSSRKLTSGTVTLELRRTIDHESANTMTTAAPAAADFSEKVPAAISATNAAATSGREASSDSSASDGLYELTLSRPLGFEIGQDENGYVVVTGITEMASNLVQYAIQVGDRIVAVDASWGGRLWPVSTVDGVTASVTGRLRSQPVTMRFERPKANLMRSRGSTGAVRSNSTTVAATTTRISPTSTSPSKERGTVVVERKVYTAPNSKELLKRCRDVLRRYSTEDEITTRQKASVQMSAMVADKVVDALASASVSLDSVTLSMIMNFYLSCDQAESAIRIFEAATGFAGNGSTNLAKEVITGKNGGQIIPTESALNLYTGTALLQAHAACGDFASVSRVLAALEGRAGVLDDEAGGTGGGLESAPWPWTGSFGSIRPDTRSYNIAIAAAERVGGSDTLYRALELFDRMSDPSPKSNKKQVNDDGTVVKNEVTYNTIISALCNAGRSDEAFSTFEQMLRTGLRPDKYTYTSLIKACVHEGDIEELLYDMKERGVKADVVTYNTMIKSLCDKRLLTQATRLVTDMESRGISPDARTYGLLMNGLMKTGNPSACLGLFESACSSIQTSSLTENVHLYTTAITAASMKGDHVHALELVSRMTGRGVKPNVKTLTSVMGACLSSGKPDVAVQIFKKIDKPDGYALNQGIRALCAHGDITSAMELIESQGRLMSGKQKMQSYKDVLNVSLYQKNYGTARRVFTDLLRRGFIPNKAMLHSIIDSMGLNRPASPAEAGEEQAVDRFRYLLFVLDSLAKRNLPIEGPLYAATLALGGQLRGVPKIIASLLARARTSAKNESWKIMEQKDEQRPDPVVGGWEELLDKFDSAAGVPIERLPSLTVRVAGKDVGRVLRAEQAVSFHRRRSSRNPAASGPRRTRIVTQS